MLFLLTSRMMISSPFVKRFTLQSEMQASQGYSTAVFSATTIGVEGKAVTDLRPSGKVDIDGVIYSASAESGYIIAGKTVIVTGNRPGLVVRELD